MWRWHHIWASMWASYLESSLFPWNFARHSTDFVKCSQIVMGLNMDWWDIITKIPFWLYSMHSLAECQILGLVLQNSRTQMGFQAELVGESKDLQHLTPSARCEFIFYYQKVLFITSHCISLVLGYTWFWLPFKSLSTFFCNICQPRCYWTSEVYIFPKHQILTSYFPCWLRS